MHHCGCVICTVSRRRKRNSRHGLRCIDVGHQKFFLIRCVRGFLWQRIIPDKNENVLWSVCLACLKMLAEQAHTQDVRARHYTPKLHGGALHHGKSAMSGVVRMPTVSPNIRVACSGQQLHRFVDGVTIQKAQDLICNRYLMAGVESMLRYEDVFKGPNWRCSWREALAPPQRSMLLPRSARWRRRW